ncbi:MAG TPA: zinc ribbon domain-containing protein [Firmicutes bacterium]|nr:zinc ribbon domain-containing protein [Bacillota bacterium]
MNKMTNCKTCGTEIAANAKICPSCGAKNKPPVYKKVWFWILIVFIVIPTIGGIIGSSRNDSNTDTTNRSVSSNHVVSPKNSSFEGDCGIIASAEMGTNIIGYPTLTISIENTSGKDISAIRFYAIPYDVYGEEISNIFANSQRELYTDDTIAAGQSDKLYYDPFIENSIKTLKLYVYSVYFADGTEWGDKDATKSTILNNGALIEVSGQS